MTDQLTVWNVALAHCGERRLASLTEPREAARVLADEWDAAVRGCLEMTTWNFATRTLQISNSGASPFNQFAYYLPKPPDWLRTADVAGDAAFTIALIDYVEEGPAWSANAGAIWVRYVSSDANYGYRLAGWPQTFADFVALTLACRICMRLTGSREMLGDLVKLRQDGEKEAMVFEERTGARAFPAGATLGKLQTFNDALGHLGLPRLVALTQHSEVVRALDDQYDTAVRWALRQASWFFASRVVALSPTAGLAGNVPFANGFLKPADWISTLDLALDPQVTQPLPGYLEESGRYYADASTIYARIVASGAIFGGDPAIWPQEFVDLVALRLAELSAGRLGAPEALDKVTVKRGVAEQAAAVLEANTQGRVEIAPDDVSRVRLEVLNGALSQLGRPRLAALTEVRVDLRALNERFDACVRWSLEQGPWTWATRTAVAQPAGYQPFNGFENSFIKPDDWLKTVTLSASGDFLRNPLVHYIDADGVWYTHTRDLAVRYVSQGVDWGFNLLRWTPSFLSLLALRLAWAVCKRLGGSDADLAGIVAQQQQAMKEARANDALNTAPVFAQPGSWSRSRSSWGRPRRLDDYPDGGSLPLLPDGLGGASGRLGGSVVDLGGADPGDSAVVDDQGRPVHTPGDGL